MPMTQRRIPVFGYGPPEKNTDFRVPVVPNVGGRVTHIRRRTQRLVAVSVLFDDGGNQKLRTIAGTVWGTIQYHC